LPFEKEDLTVAKGVGGGGTCQCRKPGKKSDGIPACFSWGGRGILGKESAPQGKNVRKGGGRTGLGKRAAGLPKS